MHLELSLELPDAPPGGRELLALDRGQARDEPAIDPFLLPPGVDGLLADAQVAREVDDIAARDQ